MTTVAASSEREIRCACSRLLLLVSSTSQAKVSVKCSRCKQVTKFLVNKVVD